MRTKLSLYAVAVGVVSIAFFSFAAAAERPQPRLVSCTWIKTINQLQAMRNNLAGSYCLANDIDASTKSNFVPVGNAANPFTGRLYGHGHVIRHLTISSSAQYIGLFGYTDQATIQDVGLTDVNIAGSNEVQIGALIGHAEASSGASTIARVSVTGQLSCISDCSFGGIVGALGANTTVTQSRSAADLTLGSGGRVGGAVGYLFVSSATLSRTSTSGKVSCDTPCAAGGLAGLSNGNVVSSYATGAVHGGDETYVGGAIGDTAGATVQQCYATGAVSGGANAFVGGLVGDLANSAVTESYAAGPVSGGTGANVGGLVGILFANIGQTTSVTESYAAGPVSGAGATLGGLAAAKSGTGTISDDDFAYWDVETTAAPGSAGGNARLTSDMRSTVPCCLPGHNNPWAQTANLSYPYLNDNDIDFASPLATLVRSSKVFVFLPINQLDPAQYMSAPAHADEASLAAVYTMIARAIGITDNDANLIDVKIDKYFWNDATQTATWTGPITAHATRGALTSLSGTTPLDATNVIGRMNQQQLVILRGTYKKSDGSAASHWLLGTLYTTADGGNLSTVVAHDPFSGAQIEIDPSTKRVLTPNFPLANFKVNGYQRVSIN